MAFTLDDISNRSPPQAADPPLPFFGSPSSSLHITVQTLLIVLLFSFSLFFRRSLIAWTSWLRNLPRLIPSNLPASFFYYLPAPLLLLPACLPSSFTCLPPFFYYLPAFLLLLPACPRPFFYYLPAFLLLLPTCLPASLSSILSILLHILAVHLFRFCYFTNCLSCLFSVIRLLVHLLPVRINL